MKNALFLLAFLLPNLALADACYSGASCRGRVLYQYRNSTTAEECLAVGGRSAGRPARPCYNIYPGSSPATPEAPRNSCVTGVCTSHTCECCTGPWKKFSEVCP